MSQAVEKNTADQQSIDNILNDIRNVVNNGAPTDDILELTEIAEKGSIQAEPEAQPESASEQQLENDSDILKVIDATLTSDQDESTAFKQPNNDNSLVNKAVAKQSQDELKKIIKAAEKSDIQSLPLRSGNTVEDLIVEMIKPYLKEWLNQNLPGIVSNVVQKEIKKLIPND